MTWIDKFQAILPSTKWPAAVRKPLRFMLIGTIGMFVQEWFFRLLMWIMNDPVKNTLWYYVAFAGGFILEMFPNYFSTNFYTFGTSPTWKNAGGFTLARGINLVLQMVVLPFALHLMPNSNNTIITYVVIFVAGIANFLIKLLFFKKKD